MNAWQRFTQWLGFGITEAYGSVIDPDDHLYRPLTARPISDLPEFQHDKMLSVCLHLDRQNPIARRLLSLITDFVFAEGVQIKTRNHMVEQVLTEHWEDSINLWDERGPRLFRQLLRDGEVVMMAGVNEVDGRVRWGTIPGRVVKDVRADPLNWEIIREVVLRPDTAGGDDRVIEHINETVNGRLEGQCIFLKLNDDGLRGISALYPLADYLDMMEQFAWSELERAKFLRAFAWDITVTGKDEHEIAQLIQSGNPAFQAPRPGTAIVHNENVVHKPITPDLEAWDATTLMSFFVNTFILGSMGIPEHWYGSGGDVNRAVGTVMDKPTIKMLTRYQRIWRVHMMTALRFVIDQAVANGRIPAMVPVENADGELTGEMIPARMAFDVMMPDMDSADMQEIGSTVNQVVQAMAVAEDRTYVSTETARDVILSIVRQLGVDIDLDAEADRLQKQAEDREKEDDVPPAIAALLAQASKPDEDAA